LLFLRITFLFCLIAILLAFLADLSLSYMVAGVRISAITQTGLTLFWAALLFFGWTVAFIVGWFLARKFHLLPFLN